MVRANIRCVLRLRPSDQFDESLFAVGSDKQASRPARAGPGAATLKRTVLRLARFFLSVALAGLERVCRTDNHRWPSRRWHGGALKCRIGACPRAPLFCGPISRPGSGWTQPAAGRRLAWAVPRQFKFDGVLHNATQEAVYDLCGVEAVESVLQGYNATARALSRPGAQKKDRGVPACPPAPLRRPRARAAPQILAYGQTGAGKTYTMSGGRDSYKQRGLIPRAISAMFSELAARSQSVGIIRARARPPRHCTAAPEPGRCGPAAARARRRGATMRRRCRTRSCTTKTSMIC